MQLFHFFDMDEQSYSHQLEDLALLIPESKPKRPRYFGLDILRIVACYMVMQLHSGQFYYSGQFASVLPGKGPVLIGFFNSLFRSAVPLFVMTSGYLLLPMRNDILTFLRSRFTRVLFPFFFWCIIYSFYNYALKNITLKQALLNIPYIFINYGCYVGHLWYIYMLIGIYLFIPILSPWCEQATIGQYIYFFSFWLLSGCIDYIHLLTPTVWGECAWNGISMLYNFNGYTGYAIFGAFVKIHLNQEEKYNLYLPAAVMVIIGYLLTVFIFEYKLSHSPIHAFDLEMGWRFINSNVIIMSCGLFLLLRKIQCKNSVLVKILQDVSTKTYGMYLCHIIILNGLHELIDPKNEFHCAFSFVLSFCTFIASYFAIKFISFIPFSKYIIG